MWFRAPGPARGSLMGAVHGCMSNLMYVRHQKRVRVQVGIDSDLQVAVGIRTEVAEPGTAGVYDV